MGLHVRRKVNAAATYRCNVDGEEIIKSRTGVLNLKPVDDPDREVRRWAEMGVYSIEAQLRRAGATRVSCVLEKYSYEDLGWGGLI